MLKKLIFAILAILGVFLCAWRISRGELLNAAMDLVCTSFWVLCYFGKI